MSDIQDSPNWIRSIPDGWRLVPLGALFDERKEAVSDSEFPALSVTKRGVVPQLSDVAKTQNGDSRKLVRSGDFVINSRSDRKGSSGISEQDGSVSVVYTVLRPREGLDTTFVHHLLRSSAFQEEFYRWGSGIVADLWSTRYPAMKKIMLPTPSLDEQRDIACFLDRETQKIDELITEQRSLIETLRERRKAVITRAVTVGIRDDARMQQVDEPALDQIPKSWQIRRIKTVGRAIIGLTYTPEDIVDEGEGRLVLRAGNIQRGALSLENNVYVDRKLPEDLKIRVGDIVICARNGSSDLIGKNAVATQEVVGETWGAFMAVLRSDINEYLRWVLNSEIFRAQTGLFSTSTINQLTSKTLHNLKFGLPSESERNEISRYLDEQISRIDALIPESEDLIALSEERRAALITAAVTGQIDVREKA
ncbi:hypothetical protein [Candidatus Corynebacterium faecigallinarum]|uniref:hypothetical protein n=1 Tax=Candidatus Corynebacterium faecigallinarum TaxID=2838528 RepID=UPI003FD38B44